MRIVSKEELVGILEKHKKWLYSEDGGERANLSGADLRSADLSDTNLSGADLSGANLRYADLRCADLSGADLSCADLSGANLSGADLRYADLSGANLRYADLRCADLSGADLRCASLDQKEHIRFGMILKEDLIAYKKCKSKLIVELCIPKGSIVFSINNSKCRTNRAKVISISNIENDKQFDKAISTHNNNFVYEVGKELEIEDFDLMYNIECSSGIHFFRTRKEAEEY